MVISFHKLVLRQIIKIETGSRLMSTFPRATSERAKELTDAYDRVGQKVKELSTKCEHPVNIVAVSKFKPSSDIMALYEHGVRHFGENYFQELMAKAAELPRDIKWHFIGGLQTGKCKDLAKKIDNLYAVEAVDSLKKCEKLNVARKSVGGSKINIFLQINTSNEEQKSGYRLDNLEELYETIEYLLDEAQCSHLVFKGLMTIGSMDESTSGKRNVDFDRLVLLRKQLEEKFLIKLETSMGMSNDYEQAIEQGSSNVRVGSSIFGSRPSKANK